MVAAAVRDTGDCMAWSTAATSMTVGSVREAVWAWHAGKR